MRSSVCSTLCSCSGAARIAGRARALPHTRPGLAPRMAEGSPAGLAQCTAQCVRLGVCPQGLLMHARSPTHRHGHDVDGGRAVAHDDVLQVLWVEQHVVDGRLGACRRLGRPAGHRVACCVCVYVCARVHACVRVCVCVLVCVLETSLMAAVLPATVWWGGVGGAVRMCEGICGTSSPLFLSHSHIRTHAHLKACTHSHVLASHTRTVASEEQLMTCAHGGMRVHAELGLRSNAPNHGHNVRTVAQHPRLGWIVRLAQTL